MLGAIIQARMSSTRLPGKVLMPICGKPLIWHIVNRLKSCHIVSEIILASTVNPADDSLVHWAETNNIKVFRDSEDDVLSRYYYASLLVDTTDILRVTADDPFKDTGIIVDVFNKYKSEDLDFAYNNKPASFPEGLDVEIFSTAALKRAFLESKDPYEREHVTQFFYRHPEVFKQGNYSYVKDLSHLRWTIDTEDDLRMVKIVYEALYNEDQVFGFQDILNLIEKNPVIAIINNNVPRSAMYVKKKI